MDTPADRKAAKKRRLREKRAAAHILKPATIADVNPPIIIAPNASTATNTATNDSECPNKDIEDLWRTDELQEKRGRTGITQNR